MTTHPAVMVSFSSPENIKDLKRRLREIRQNFEDFEVEELALYGLVEKRLMRAGLSYNKAYEPT